LPEFSPGEGLCNQTPVICPFPLLYPYPRPPHAEEVSLDDPLPLPELPPLPEPLPLPDPVPLLEPELFPAPLTVVIEFELPPHPARSKAWRANANEQRKERKSRTMHAPTPE